MLYGYVSWDFGYLEIVGTKDIIEAINFKKEKQHPEKIVGEIAKAKQQIESYLKKELTTFDLNLNLNQGTPFQRSCWQAMQTIPFGKTISYKEEATLINSPKAVRAVGTANGKNPFPIVIPCHRVINQNNKLGGFGGGIDMKIWLLEHEKSF